MSSQGCTYSHGYTFRIVLVKYRKLSCAFVCANIIDLNVFQFDKKNIYTHMRTYKYTHTKTFTYDNIIGQRYMQLVLIIRYNIMF